MLPIEIQHIINDYKEEFERVEDQIEECLQKYYDIEEKVENFKSQIQNSHICHHHKSNVTISLTQTTREAARIIERILEEETVHSVQLLLLTNLENDILIDIFNVMCHPYMLYPAHL